MESVCAKALRWEPAGSRPGTERKLARLQHHRDGEESVREAGEPVTRPRSPERNLGFLNQ